MDSERDDAYEENVAAKLGPEWVSDDALDALVTERTIHPEESHEDTARRLFRENVGVAALGIIHIAQHGSSERTRLDAQKYMIERVLGKVGDDAFVSNPTDDFIDAVTEYVKENA